MSKSDSDAEFHYRLDLFLDGNGARPHKILRSPDCSRLLNAAEKEPRYPETVWIVWKDFADFDVPRHLITVTRAFYKTLDEILEKALERDKEVGRPIPAPDNPPSVWV